MSTVQLKVLCVQPIRRQRVRARARVCVCLSVCVCLCVCLSVMRVFVCVSVCACVRVTKKEKMCVTRLFGGQSRTKEKLCSLCEKVKTPFHSVRGREGMCSTRNCECVCWGGEGKEREGEGEGELSHQVSLCEQTHACYRCDNTPLPTTRASPLKAGGRV